MSKRKHEINNLLTNARLGQDALIEYLQSFRRALEKANNSKDLRSHLESERIQEKLEDLNEVVDLASRSFEKIVRYLAS